jgi:hypothetical protein
MKLLAALVFLVLPSCLIKTQTTSDNAPKEPPLATLTAHLEKTAYKHGEHFQVTLTLRAGPQGAYVSKGSKVSPNDKQNSSVGRAISNVSGFDVSLLTLDGKNAETIVHSGVADRFAPVPPPSERFKEEFLFLKPGEEESWFYNVDGTSVKPGKYQIIGIYMPAYDQVHELVGLPEARGPLIADVVKSAPIIITIE